MIYIRKIAKIITIKFKLINFLNYIILKKITYSIIKYILKIRYLNFKKLIKVKKIIKLIVIFCLNFFLN